MPSYTNFVADPLKLQKLLWPDVTFYRKQRQVIYSVWDNDKTVVPAGHMLGKDYVAGFITLAFFLTRHPCRVVTTSVDGDQLEGVLWGEIRRYLQTSKYPLDYFHGGPLIINHLHIRKIVGGTPCGISYMLGRVAAAGEGLSGHHIAQTGDGIPRTLFVVDEASGVARVSFEKGNEWCNRALYIGNPYSCDNEFKWAVEGDPKTREPGGDIRRSNGVGYERKIIEINAEDSPNVQYARAQQRAGLTPTNEIIVPGVLPWEEYQIRLRKWDEAKKCAGLFAKFYKGGELLLFPPGHLNFSKQRAGDLLGRARVGRAMGIDPAEGGDRTAICVIDGLGVVDIVSLKTSNTDRIPRMVLNYMKRYNVPEDRVVFDRGGGGKQHADRLRGMGYRKVRTVNFGDTITVEPRQAKVQFRERKDSYEDRGTYANRRAQMYGEAATLLDPVENPQGFAIPGSPAGKELMRQLELMPRVYDREGRLKLPPKNKQSQQSRETTLIDIIGCSPDEADAFVLAVHAMLHRGAVRAFAGAVG